MKHRTATNGWPTWVVRQISPSVIAAIRPIPDDRPSSPSMKLMLLIIPTNHRTREADRDGPSKRIDARPERVLDEVDA